jgi:hypothetical protein
MKGIHTITDSQPLSIPFHISEVNYVYLNLELFNLNLEFVNIFPTEAEAFLYLLGGQCEAATQEKPLQTSTFLN